MRTAWVSKTADGDAKQHSREDCTALRQSETEKVDADECDRERCAHCHDDIQIAPKGGLVAKLWDTDQDEVGRTETGWSA